MPDVSVVLGSKPSERIISRHPFIVIEVLSSEDRPTDTETKVAEYLDFGIPYVWVFDSESKLVMAHTRHRSVPMSSGKLRTVNPEIVLPLSKLF